MIKIKRKASSPDFQEENATGSDYINFMNLKKDARKILKFKPILEDKKYIPLSKKNSSDNFDFNISEEKRNFLEIKSIYNYIINQIESLMNRLNKNNYEDIYSTLIKIKKALNKIIYNKVLVKRDISHRSEIPDGEDNYNNCRYTYDKRFILSNEKEKYNSFITTSKFFKINNNSKRIKLLEQKNIDLEDKLKTEKLKYLLCIGEQNKKIKELEKELNQKSFDNMTQDEIKQYRCFPYYKKFEVLDKIQNKTKKNNKNKRYQNIFFEQKEKLNNSEKKEEIIENGEKVINNKELEKNKLSDKKGNYFISHPKLKYIKNDLNMKTWKNNELLDSLPKELLKHKFNSKSQKNHIIVFPSSLNQIMVNLEKLRIHNNFERIEYEFKENNRSINKEKKI